MSFQNLLEPEVFDRFINLVRNNVVVRAWYSAVSNPEHPIAQDVNTIMWLVELLALESDRLKQSMFDHLNGKPGFSMTVDPNDLMLEIGKAYQDVAKARTLRDESATARHKSKSGRDSS